MFVLKFKSLINFLNLKTNRGRNKIKITNILITLVYAIALLILDLTISFAKAVGDKIILGAAVSLTGKYSSNGVHSQNGYNLAVEIIYSMSGVKVGGETAVLHLDDWEHSEDLFNDTVGRKNFIWGSPKSKNI